MPFEIPGDGVAQSVTNTISIFTAIYIAGRPLFLTVGSVLILASMVMTLRHKPPTFTGKEIGPYNPKFDPLQKKHQLEANKWRFMAMIVFVFGLTPWILELMIFAGAV